MTTQAQETSRLREFRRPPPAAATVAANVRRIRESRSFSQQELALASGTQLRTLEQLERGAHEPGIQELWKLAKALHVPFSSLLAAPLESPERRQEVSRPALVRPARSVASRRLWPKTGGPRRTEVHELKLAPHAIERASAHAPGAIESLLVTAGSAIVLQGGRRRTLKAGESMTLAADTERSFANPGATETTVYVLLTLPPARG
jgi:transcriptional regulator with XRE-family HTH domain